VSLPRAVTVVEVGPRDGLQNVSADVPTAAKIAFIEALADAGLRVVEAASFVSPRAVPQLRDGAQVLAGLRARTGVRYPVLVPNEKGLDAALAAGAREIAVFTAASEAFNRRNVNAGIEESIERFRPVVRRAREASLRVRGYVSTAFGCPFQGDVPVDDVVRVTARLVELGCDEVSVGDTIGIAHPGQVHEMIPALAAAVGVERIALHLHDTWGRALANVLAGLEAGVTTYDSSAGGLGGCPFAPGATGNVGTEDVVDLLERMGIATGIDVEKVADASLALHAASGIALPSRTLQAIGARRARREAAATS
jgi:hydroxymethylglutaryl-CoA lyase